MQYAVKAINLTDIQPQTLIRLRREIQVLPRAGLVLGAQPSTTFCCLSTFCAAGCARARSVLPASSWAGGFWRGERVSCSVAVWLLSWLGSTLWSWVGWVMVVTVGAPLCLCLNAHSDASLDRGEGETEARAGQGGGLEVSVCQERAARVKEPAPAPCSMEAVSASSWVRVFVGPPVSQSQEHHKAVRDLRGGRDAPDDHGALHR
jgi:hypothetical protein